MSAGITQWATNYGDRTEVPLREAVEEVNGRWYIKMGFAGFNSRANNLDGYHSEIAAMRAIVRHGGMVEHG